MVTCGFVSITCINDGRYGGAALIFAAGVHLILAIKSQDKLTIAWSSRINAAIQASIIVWLDEGFPVDVGRRAVVVRTISALGAHDNLIDPFLELMTLFGMLWYRFGLDSPVTWLPIKVFFGGVVSMELLGLRALFVEITYRIVSQHALMRNVLISAGIPFSTILFSYAVVPVVSPASALVDDRLSFTLFGWMSCLLSMGLMFYSDKFDILITATLGIPTMACSHQDRSQKSGHAYLALACGMTLAIGENAEKSALSFVVLAFFVLSRCVPFRFTTEFLVPVAEPPTSSARWFRRSIVFCHSFLLVVAYYLAEDEIEKYVWKSWFLSFTYVLFSFVDVDVPISEIVMDNLISTATQMFVAPKSCLPGMVLICVFNIATGLMLRVSRGQWYRLIDSMRASDAFLDHAVKQKLSAIGAALENLMKTEHELLTHPTKTLLNGALEECRIGHDACYLSSVLMQLDADIVAFSNDVHRLRSLVREWVRKRVFNEFILDDAYFGSSGSHSPPEEGMSGGNENDLYIFVNVDVLRALLNDMLKRTGVLIIVLCKQEKYVDFACMHEIANTDRLEIRSRCVRALGGVLLSDGKTIRLTIYTRLEAETMVLGGGARIWKFPSLGKKSSPSAVVLSPHGVLSPHLAIRRTSISGIPSNSSSPDQSLSSSSFRGVSPNIFRRRLPPLSSSISQMSLFSPTNSGITHSSPMEYPDLFPASLGLTIAVLDDNALVRMSINRTLKTFCLQNVPDSNSTKVRVLVRGATADEARQFPNDIVTWKCDIALFDQNLDYDDKTADTSLHGTTLAELALTNGFQGCVILHSANRSYHDNLPPVFDGFIEKTSDYEQFCSALVRCWARYRAKLGEVTIEGCADNIAAGGGGDTAGVDSS